MWRQQRTQSVLVAALIIVFLLVAGYMLSGSAQIQLKNHWLQAGEHHTPWFQGHESPEIVPANDGGESSSSASHDSALGDKDASLAEDAQRPPDASKEVGNGADSKAAGGKQDDTDASANGAEATLQATPEAAKGNKDGEDKLPVQDKENDENSESIWHEADSAETASDDASKQAVLQGTMRTPPARLPVGSEEKKASKENHSGVDYSEFSMRVVNETKDFAADLEEAKTSVSYDKTSPPSVGCEDIVAQLQSMVIEAFAEELKGIRHAHIFGLLDRTENKGDAVIWVAQEILLATLGITTMETCRYIDRDCDVPRWDAGLKDNAPHAGIIMAGGGNFNDFFEDDHPARLKMVQEYGDRYPIRMFPQSINMTTPRWTEETLKVFAGAKDAQLGARDLPSYEWLDKAFGKDDQTGIQVGDVRTTLTPDIAFMFGNRPEIRRNTKKTHDIYILARDDSEVAEGESSSIAKGDGVLDLGPEAGEVTYLKNDWRRTPTPMNGAEGPKQRNWAKAMHGFEILANAEFVITDRLHGHIMCTLMGIPHVLMDSKLKKNLFFHNTWTKDCDCVRVADNIDEAVAIAKLYFEKQTKDGLRTKKAMSENPTQR